MIILITRVQDLRLIRIMNVVGHVTVMGMVPKVSSQVQGIRLIS